MVSPTKLKKYCLLDSSLKAVSDGTIPLLILKGSAGFGKSYTTKKYLEDNKTSYKLVNTYSTPLAFYKILHENKDRDVIVFDDITTTDKKITAILKSACNNIGKDRVVMWNSTSKILEDEQLPSEFKLNANVVLILNNDLPEFKPIINRAVSINFEFSFNDTIKILRYYQQDAGIDDEILEHIATNCNGATSNISIRSAVILSKLKEKGYLWTSFAQEMFQTDEDVLLLKELVAKSQDIKNACKEWCKQTGHHRATFYRKKKLI